MNICKEYSGVYQLRNLINNRVLIGSSERVIGRDLKINNTSVNSCLVRRQRSAKGYIFNYKEKR